MCQQPALGPGAASRGGIALPHRGQDAENQDALGAEKDNHGDDGKGGVRNVVGIVAARLRERQNIDSGGEVNWLIDELGCECLPTIDLAHVDLS
jgi:hypothetical protein